MPIKTHPQIEKGAETIRHSRILSSTAPAHAQLFELIDIFSENSSEGSFIFHSQPERSPWVILDLAQLIESPAIDITLNLHNRLIDNEELMLSRIDHLEVHASKDAYNWRKVPILLGEEFRHGRAPIQIKISSAERFLRFCNYCENPTTELTLGSLTLDSKSKARIESFSTSRFKRFCSYFRGLSNSQLLQDLLPLYFLGLQPGIFFEAGIADGITLSNTFILEKLFGWQGIGVEPLPEYFTKATAIRVKTKMLNCALVPSDTAEVVSLRTGGLLSSLDQAMPQDSHSERRSTFGRIDVPARSFMSIIKESGYQRIDFLSLDLEGLELAILKSIDFSLIPIQIIATEHNHTQDRAQIHQLLSSNDYTRVFQDISSHDDFYVHDSVIPFSWNESNLFGIKHGQTN